MTDVLLYSRGHQNDSLTSRDTALDKLGPKKKVLAIPPDFTRCHSRAGELTALAWQHYGSSLTDILPALGTHAPMTPSEMKQMFKGVPPELFRKHNWRTDLATLGEVPSEFVREVSEGRVDYSWPAQVNRLLVEGKFDLILSIGQVVPHEVSGMANYNKNIFIGTGGADGINKSHFLGAAYGMERIMGRADNPVRRVINYASEHFAKDMPVVYVLTVVSGDEDGTLKTRGLCLSRPVRIQKYLAGQQEYLSNPDGDGRRRRANRAGTGSEPVRRRPANRPAYPQIRLCRDSGHP
jgi:nickel-dependent lactate racemase